MNYYNTLNSLNAYNFLFTLDICIDIDGEYQKHLNPAFAIKMYGKSNFDIVVRTEFDDPLLDERGAYFNRRAESLDFLHNLGVLTSYKCEGNADDVEPTVNLEINPDKFEELKTALHIIYNDRYAQAHPSNAKFGCFIDSPIRPEQPKPAVSSEIPQEPIKKLQREVVYEIRYSENGEIFLNNFLFGKVQFNGENETVFSYLFKHPNKRITKAEFKEKAGYSVGKPLHKIVDNLGFTGNLRKAFFIVSEQAILFRNPLTKKELEKLNIPPLKLKKKAII